MFLNGKDGFCSKTMNGIKETNTATGSDNDQKNTETTGVSLICNIFSCSYFLIIRVGQSASLLLACYCLTEAKRVA